jgi:hypothetical protein
VFAATFIRFGCVAEQEGDLEAAAEWHAKAMGAVTGLTVLPVNPTLAGVVDGLAALAVAHGDHIRASDLLGAAHTLRGFSDRRSYETLRTTGAATGALGRTEFHSVYERGGGSPGPRRSR